MTALPCGLRAHAAAIRTVVLVLLLMAGGYSMAVAVVAQPHPLLALLALLPVFRAIQVLRPRAAMLGGAFWGASLYAFIAAGETVQAPGWLACALLSLLPACYAGLGAYLTRRIGFRPFVLAVGWMPIELALQPLALHHGLLPGTAGEGWLLGVVGRTFGYVLVGFLLAFASAVLLATLTRVRLHVRLHDPRRWGLDETARGCWHAVRTWRPRSHAGCSRPRAPPVGAHTPFGCSYSS